MKTLDMDIGFNRKDITIPQLEEGLQFIDEIPLYTNIDTSSGKIFYNPKVGFQIFLGEIKEIKYGGIEKIKDCKIFVTNEKIIIYKEDTGIFNIFNFYHKQD